MSEWISVEKELPDIEEEFYIWPPCNLGDKHYTATFDKYDTESWLITYEIGGGYDATHFPKVTHWKPIEPPIEDNKEG